ncbi:VIT1/CCC1 transporter family protein [Patescibacteria group bacterium]
MTQKNKNFKLFTRNFIFGVEDGLVSTVGLLSGVAVAGMSKTGILIAGLVLIFVEAFSMGAGSLISEHSSEEYTRKKHPKYLSHMPGALIMLVSYFVAGLIPLFPYLVLDIDCAFWTSIFFSLFALFALGAINAKIFKVRLWQHALEMLIIGGLAIGVGVGIGTLAQFIK